MHCYFMCLKILKYTSKNGNIKNIRLREDSTTKVLNYQKYIITRVFFHITSTMSSTYKNKKIREIPRLILDNAVEPLDIRTTDPFDAFDPENRWTPTSQIRALDENIFIDINKLL